LHRLTRCTHADVSYDVSVALKRALSGLTGRVLVSKVFLGRTQQAGGENGLGFNQRSNQVNGR
jgi:hypothetical protein